MSDEVTTVVDTVEPTVEAPPAEVVQPDVPPPVEEPEQVYHYQPTDEHGRSLGGKQVIKYKTHDELVQRLTEQNTLLVRKLREETRKQRLGIMDEEDLPTEADAPRFDAPLEFTPRVLTPDERVQLSRDLLDPERFDEASSTLFEATVGAKPEMLRNTLTNLQVSNLRLLAKTESDAFVAANPTYHKCQENFEAITGWMQKNNLAPLRENFQLAYDRLKLIGVILEAAPTPEPISVPTQVDPVVPTQVEPAPTEELTEPAPTRRGVPSGLTRQQATDVGVSQHRKTLYTLAEINAMPADVYKRKLLGEKGFAELVDQLEREVAAKRGRR